MPFRAHNINTVYQNEDDAFLAAFEGFVFDMMGTDYWNNTDAPEGFDYSYDAAVHYLSTHDLESIKNSGIICYEVHQVTAHCGSDVREYKKIIWDDGAGYEVVEIEEIEPHRGLKIKKTWKPSRKFNEEIIREVIE